jgi:hypothetical protein
MRQVDFLSARVEAPVAHVDEDACRLVEEP